jgi:hypothetical protein
MPSKAWISYAGADAGATVSPVDATTLTAGMHFVCF